MGPIGLKPGALDILAGWDGVGGGREVPEEGGHIFTYSDSC